MDVADGGDIARPGPDAAVDGPARPRRWRLLAVIAGGLVVGELASVIVMAILYLNSEEPITSLSSTGLVLSTLVMGAVLGLILSFLILSDSSVTPEDCDAQQTKPLPPGRHRRGYKPPRVPDNRDEVLANELTREQWRIVANRLRGRRVPTLVRRVAMLPVLTLGTAVTLVLAGRDWLMVLPDSFVYTAGPWIGLLVGLGWLLTQVSDLRAVWQEPMLLVRGVVGDVDGAALGPGPDPKELTGDIAAAASGMEHASVVLAVPRIQLLHADGRLENAPPSVYLSIYTADVPTDGSPRKLLLHCSRRTAKRLHHGDRVALLCWGDKCVAVRLRDLLDPATKTEHPASGR